MISCTRSQMLCASSSAKRHAPEGRKSCVVRPTGARRSPGHRQHTTHLLRASPEDKVSITEELEKKKGSMNDYVEPDASISKDGLIQLVKMGLGAISSDIKEINLDDPERTVVMELEANNFEDAKGNPLWKPDEEGYVDTKNEPNAGILNIAVPAILGLGATGLVIATLSKL